MITPAWRILYDREYPVLLCLLCNRVSYNLSDIRHRYYGACRISLREVPRTFEQPQTEGYRPDREREHADAERGMLTELATYDTVLDARTIAALARHRGTVSGEEGAGMVMLLALAGVALVLYVTLVVVCVVLPFF